ncbi:carbohydrate sulfotransferase 11-like [Mercenaria mercenaria]|uniref:carbohydrate sulfotransferase 11-like n=1 Tax=Mercenaria mercenaria TaxID=6596 RepID=UPI00234F9C2B|nr:carbohydrate sulfotransferase 11-like [Mercenaria mercenaria]
MRHMKLKRRLNVLLSFSLGAVIIEYLAVKGLPECFLNRYTAEEVKMSTRVDKLNHMCNWLVNKGYELKESQRFKHIIVDDKYKVMFCYVPKVACTNFIRIFLSMKDKINSSDPMHLKAGDVHILKKNLTFLDTYSIPEVEYRIKHYTKAIFVREPLERVFSAYRNKFFETNNPIFMHSFGEKILRIYRNKSTVNSSDTGGVKFTEFVQYLLDSKTIKHGYNEHWELFSNLCHPCLIRYNFIGKYESLETDANSFLKQIDLEGKIKFPKKETYYKHKSSAELLSVVYKNIQPEMFQNLTKIFERDYLLFDYEIPSRQQIIKKRV